jgi:hypothetical protein
VARYDVVRRRCACHNRWLSGYTALGATCARSEAARHPSQTITRSQTVSRALLNIAQARCGSVHLNMDGRTAPDRVRHLLSRGANTLRLKEGRPDDTTRSDADRRTRGRVPGNWRIASSLRTTCSQTGVVDRRLDFRRPATCLRGATVRGRWRRLVRILFVTASTREASAASRDVLARTRSEANDVQILCHHDAAVVQAHDYAGDVDGCRVEVFTDPTATPGIHHHGGGVCLPASACD